MSHKTKNNYHQVLGISFIVVVFATVVSLVYLWQVIRAPITHPNYNIQSQKVKYHDTAYNFDLKYPKSYVLDTDGTQQNYFRTGAKTIASISVPQTVFPKTNFGSAQITFAAKEKSTTAACQTYFDGNTVKKMTKTVVLEKNKYFTDSFKEGAAGTTYETKIYHLLHNDVCFEASVTVGIANIGNYEPGSVSAVVEADIWNTLSCVLVSFKFRE
jgi:hypothetical protein